MVVLKCKECGNELSGKRKSFCSSKCRDNYWNGKNFDITCKECNKLFKGTRYTNICSDCKGKAKTKAVKGKCVVCGCEILGSKSKKYCSRSCQNKNASTRTCVFCNNIFKGAYTTKTCSLDCENSYRKLKSEEKLINRIKELYPEFEILNNRPITSKSIISLKCNNDGHIISKSYKTILQGSVKCNECEITEYYLNPVKCKNCKNFIPFDDKDKQFCNHKCSIEFAKNKSIIEQDIFDAENDDVLQSLFRSGYSELKIKDVTGLNYSKIKKYIKERNYLKHDLINLEDCVIKSIQTNDFIDFKSLGYTRDASLYFKNKYTSMLNFLKSNGLNYSDKYFKCFRCGEYHLIDHFSTLTMNVRNGYFGIGICKYCIRLESKKRKRKSQDVDKYMTSKYISKVNKKFSNKCALCESLNNIHIDHFIPLSWNMKKALKGNYIPLCERCNVKHKSNRNIKEWNDTYSTDYSVKIEEIMKWLSKENKMTYAEYVDYYWDTYNNFIKVQSVKNN